MSTQLSLFDTTEFTPTHKPDLADVLACLNSIPHINHGGCGVAALAIYRWCKANNYPISDRPFVFVWIEDFYYEAKENDEHLLNNEIKRVEAPNHVVIEMDAGLYDCEGDQTEWVEECLIQQEYHLNEDEFLQVINKKKSWNSEFSRKRQIPKIEFGLGIDLSDVVK